MEVVDVFSDASQNGKFFAGAFIVGKGGVVRQVAHNCENSGEAELLTMIAAICEASKHHHPTSLRVHTDLVSIAHILNRHKRVNRQPGATLAGFRDMGVQFVGDGNSHDEHKTCHRHARIAAGINGKKHPKRQAKLETPKPASPKIRTERKIVFDQLRRHYQPVSELRLWQECGLSSSIVRRVLNWLRNRHLAICILPKDSLAACDNDQVKWQVVEVSPVEEMDIAALIG